MAEPLLKRTFSRLRGKDRSRRKTDPKLADGATKSSELVLASSAPSSSASSANAELSHVEDITRRSQITVSKKQNWAKLSSASKEPACTEIPLDPPGGPRDWDICSGKPMASKQAWSQRTLSEDGLPRRCNDLDWEAGFSRAPCDVQDACLPELTPLSSAYTEVCVSGQRSYLQSLERSSRAWVLSTGKPQASDEASSRLLSSSISEWRQGAEGESNIWYNPIPEEEDLRGENTGNFGDPWRRREKDGFATERRDVEGKTQRTTGLVGNLGSCGGASRECQTINYPVGGATAGSEHNAKAIHTESSICQRSERTDVQQVVEQPEACAAGLSIASSSSSSSSGGGGVVSASGSSADSPGVLKKGAGVGAAPAGTSVMDKIKSPGTVRRLSLKMRKLPELRRKLSLRSSRTQRQGQGQGQGTDEASPPNPRKEASNNVISRYHLDSSAPSRPRRRSSRTRSSAKGGYLSDGDSPELQPKQGSAEQIPPPSNGAVGPLEPGAFRLYSLAEQPRCGQRVSGLLTVHLLGAEELLRSPQPAKEVFCAIQVDGVTRARTALLTCKGATLPLNHTFNLELERARLLKLVVLTPSGTATTATGSSRNRVCGLGAVAIPSLFRGLRSQQLCVRLEPRGLLYVKLTLLEQWEAPPPRLSELPPPSVFGVQLRHLVEKEGAALQVPLLIQKCVTEIEKRGLKVVGLYRLCGSAAVKKELRDAFERDSAAVALTEELYPDVNVITGILKDYLRELPSPLITRRLYEVVLEAMCHRPVGRSESDAQRSQSTVALLQCLPEPERATLSFLLDHLSLVASFSESNRMTCQNLAVCFGPVLLTPTQESWRPIAPGSGSGVSSGVSRGGRSFAHSEEIASAVDFKRHIEALHYLLQLWPIPTGREQEEPDQWPSTAETSGHSPSPPPPSSQHAVRRHCQRVPLRVELPQDVVVSLRSRGRLESPPCNRYAGDWSVCGRNFLSPDDADYDEVAGSESEEDEQEEALKKEQDWTTPDGLYVDDFALDFDAPFTCRLSLKDFDTLISDLERELAKQINICL